MRKLMMLCVFVSVGLLASEFNTADAGLIWSSGASVVSKQSGVSEFNNISRSTGAPDAVSWAVSTQLTSPPSQVKTLVAQWTFTGGVPGNQSFFGLFRFTNAASSVSAQVVSYTTGGSAVSVTGTTVVLPKITGNTLVGLPFALPGSGTTITAVNVKFTFTGYARYNLDAFGTPEPGTFVLFGAGLLGLGVWARKRRRRKLS